jgi:hypothetical protein
LTAAIVAALSMTAARADGVVHRIDMRMYASTSTCGVGVDSNCAGTLWLETDHCAAVDEYAGAGFEAGSCNIQTDTADPNAAAAATVASTGCSGWTVTLDDPASVLQFTTPSDVSYRLTHGVISGTLIESAAGYIVWLVTSELDGSNDGASVRLATTGFAYGNGSCQAGIGTNNLVLMLDGFGYFTSA